MVHIKKLKRIQEYEMIVTLQITLFYRNYLARIRMNVITVGHIDYCLS